MVKGKETDPPLQVLEEDSDRWVKLQSPVFP
jgi:hypothetical protein